MGLLRGYLTESYLQLKNNMEDKLVYLESDEEITSVIDKISKTGSVEVALVIPRGGNLAQSIVNLKLLKKRASDLGKEVSLVTTDKISRNLASQVGISVYSKIEEVGKNRVMPAPIYTPREIPSNTETIKSDVPAPVVRPAEELPELPGIKINRYYDSRPKVTPDESSSPKGDPLGSKTESSEPEASTPEILVEPAEESKKGSEIVETQEPEEKIKEIPEASEGDVLQETQEPEGTEEQKTNIPEVIEMPPVSEPVAKKEPEFSRRVINEARTRQEEQHENAEHRKQNTAEDNSEDQIELGHQAHKKEKLPGRRFKPMRKRKALAALIALAVIIILAFGYLILPQAKATVVFKAENFEKASDVTIDKNATAVDTKTLTVPATQSSVEKTISEKFTATGKKNIGNKASGTITFYNASELTPQKIASGSSLTANGKSFVTDGDITIPAVSVVSVIPPVFNPGTVTGKVVAAAAGEDSNLPSGTKYYFNGFSGTKQNNVYGQSSSALTGGSTQEVTIVQASDISGAQDKIKSELTAQSKDEVLKKIPANDKFVDGTQEETQSGLKASAAVGDQVADFTFTGNTKITILTFNENLLRDMLVEKYQTDLAANRILVQSDKIALEYTIKTKPAGLDTTLLGVNLKGKISSKIDTEKLRDDFRGKKISDATNTLLGLDLVKSASIKMTPELSLYKTMPLLKNSIKIETVYETE